MFGYMNKSGGENAANELIRTGPIRPCASVVVRVNKGKKGRKGTSRGDRNKKTAKGFRLLGGDWCSQRATVVLIK